MVLEKINENMIYTFVGLGILAIFIILYLVIACKRNGNKGKAYEFLNGILEQIKKVVLGALANIPLSDLKDPEKLAEFVDKALDDIYDKVWEFIQSVVNKKEEGAIDEAALVFLNNKKFVDKYVREIVDELQVKEQIEEKAIEQVDLIAQETLDKSAEEDLENQEKFSDKSMYIDELDEDADLTRGLDTGSPTDAIEGYEEPELNPQRDEEEVLDPENDASVEVIEDEEDDIYYDKSGRARSKKTGKWIKTSK